jgi:hypothetical protein
MYRRVEAVGDVGHFPAASLGLKFKQHSLINGVGGRTVVPIHTHLDSLKIIRKITIHYKKLLKKANLKG